MNNLKAQRPRVGIGLGGSPDDSFIIYLEYII